MDEPVPPTRSRGSEPPPPATAAWAYPGRRNSNGLSRSVVPLLAGYLTFGQYWGVWVVVFADYLAFHGFTEGEAGVQMSILAVVSIVTMVFGSPRLQAVRLHLSVAPPFGLGVPH